MKKPIGMKVKIRPTKETQKQIYELVILDYQEQLEELKELKFKMPYEEYRYYYIRLHNGITDTKKQLKKLIGE